MMFYERNCMLSAMQHITKHIIKLHKYNLLCQLVIYVTYNIMWLKLKQHNHKINSYFERIINLIKPTFQFYLSVKCYFLKKMWVIVQYH